MPLKRDADAIMAHMRELGSAAWLGPSRDWWPDFLFRTDHVENAADILNCGELLSRAAAEDGSLINKDSGSPSHIAQLGRQHRRMVRLYFRPRTPTQYSNEGFRPIDKIKYDAHMPVPVYLLFNSSLLSEQGVSFSRGRLTTDSRVGTSAAFLAGMNFKDIYHVGSVGSRGSSVRRSEILNSRHSEVLVQDRLSLDCLRLIVCRSGPERETLLNLLEPAVRARWERKIVEDDGRKRLYHRFGTFISEAHLSENGSRFTFHVPPDPRWRRPFHLRISWSGTSGNYNHSDEEFAVPDTPLKMTFPNGATESKYDVKLRLNDDIAYFGQFRSEDSFLDPF